MEDSPRISKSISIYAEEERIIDTFAQQKGLDFSSALRFIIREWFERQKEKLN